MSGDDSFPNFDWLKQGIGSQSPAPSNSEPPAPPAETPPAEPADVEDSGSAIDDLEQLPDPQMNESDGSTLIIRHDDFSAEEPPISPREVAFTPGNEEFSAPEAEVPPVGEPDLPDVHAALLGPPSAEPANESEAIEANPADPVPVASTQRFPWDPDPVAAMGNPETAFALGAVAGAAAASQPQEPEDTVLEESPTAAPSGTDDESHTEVLKSDEVPRPSPGSWPDFAMPVAAAATAAALLPTSDDAIPVRSKSKKPAAAAVSATTQGPNRMFVILASYASAITLAFIALLVRDLSLTFRPHNLESLPDIASEKVENLSYIPANATLPPGHTLVFGEARRFGNILVEPIKITQEPAAFVHYTGDAKKQKEPTAPVWKLWLKLTNVSETQTIAPLDRRLVLRWVPKARQTWDYTNYYITERDTTDRNAPHLQLYRLPSASDWDLKDQELGKELKPGESYITYLASTDEGFESLGQDLVWRVQIRKGYSKQGHGVTTIFQVAFKKDEVTKTAS